GPRTQSCPRMRRKRGPRKTRKSTKGRMEGSAPLLPQTEPPTPASTARCPPFFFSCISWTICLGWLLAAQASEEEFGVGFRGSQRVEENLGGFHRRQGRELAAEDVDALEFLRMIQEFVAAGGRREDIDRG